LLNNTYVW